MGAAQILLNADGTRYALASGEKYKVTTNAVTSITGNPPVKLAKIGKTLSAHSTGRTGGVLLRGGRDFHPAPLGAVPNGAVKLTWAWDCEQRQELKIVRRDGKEEVLTTPLGAAVREFNLPVGKLRPGVWYTWTVRADEDHTCGGPIRIETREDAGSIAAMEQDADALRRDSPDDPTPDLLRAEGYVEFGLFDKARDAYAAALKLRPDDDGIKNALQQIP